MSVIGTTIADTDRYDWGLILGSCVLALSAVVLHVPLWLVAIIAFIGPVIVSIRGACHDLGLLRPHDADKAGATATSDAEPDTDARSSNTRPASLRLRPSTDKP